MRVVADGEALLAPSITRRLVARFAAHLTTPQPCAELERLIRTYDQAAIIAPSHR